jgi:hypothetical protein
MTCPTVPMPHHWVALTSRRRVASATADDDARLVHVSRWKGLAFGGRATWYAHSGSVLARLLRVRLSKRMSQHVLVCLAKCSWWMLAALCYACHMYNKVACVPPAVHL